MRTRTRLAGALIVLAAISTAAVLDPTAVATATEATTPDDGLDEARDELDGVSRSMAELEAQLKAVSDEVEALDRRLGAANAELAAIRTALATAESAVERARADEEAAAARLVVAQDELAEVEAELAATRARLELRIVSTFKHGTLTTADVIVRGTTGSLDLHELAVTMNAVGRMTDDDRALVARTTELADAQRDLIDSVEQARREAIDAGRRAEVERERTAEIAAEQAAVVGRIQQDRSRRREVLAALEADTAIKAALAAKLRRQIAALELSRLIGLTPPGTVSPGAPAWASRLPDRGKPWAEMINNAGIAQGVDGRLMAALVWTESYFNPNAVSSAGAVGMAQLMPGTARGLGLRVDAEVDERYDPVLNTNAGAKYLYQQLVRFGSVELALAAYNAGPTRVASCMCIPNFTETQLYVVRVLDRYAHISG
jgi:soluble lytic murein transglycosylase-like protein